MHYVYYDHVREAEILAVKTCNLKALIFLLPNENNDSGKSNCPLN